MFYHNLSSFVTLFQNIISTSTGLVSVHICMVQCKWSYGRVVSKILFVTENQAIM